MRNKKQTTRWGVALAGALGATMLASALVVITGGDSPSVAAVGYDKNAESNGWPMNSRGEPRTEDVDPASQGQTSLDEAAEEPKGIGVTELASGMKKSKPRRDIKPDEVLANYAAKNGGCIGEYGEPGQCLPVVPPSHAGHDMDVHVWECSELRRHFKKGITLRVAGVDPQNLDTNKDNIACGPGDTA
jgi:hypothetical protein